MSTDIQVAESTKLEGLAVMNGLPTILMVFAVVLACLFIWVMFLGGAKSVMRFLGGAKYMDSTTKAKILPTIRLLIDSGVNPEEAAKTGCCLFGANEKVAQNLNELVRNSGNLNQTRALASYYAKGAEQRIHNMKTATRTALITVVGGAITLCYGMAIFSPIINLLYKLLATGT